MIAPCYRLSNYISRNKELDQGHTANEDKSSLKARSLTPNPALFPLHQTNTPDTGV